MDSVTRPASERVASLERCLPAKTRRRSDCGRFVRRASRERSVEIEVEVGSVRGITMRLPVSDCCRSDCGGGLDHSLLPAMFLTKIWMVSSEEDDVDDSDEMLLERLERMMTARVMMSVSVVW